MQLTLRGGVCLYQGEELGQEEAEIATAEQEVVDTGNDLLAFYRRGGSEQLLVALNMGTGRETFALPEEFAAAEDITPPLFAGEVSGGEIRLPVAGARVLRQA